jgi:hypothetical protein
MRKRAADRDAKPGGRFIRAWRWLRSSGFHDDGQAEPGPATDQQAKERVDRNAATQLPFWTGH